MFFLKNEFSMLHFKAVVESLGLQVTLFGRQATGTTENVMGTTKEAASGAS